MDINFCQICGEKLILKEIGDEGMIPYCEACSKPYFNSPAPCVLVVVINEYNEVALLKQDYVSTIHWGLIAGFITEGENAEETGLNIRSLQYISSFHQSPRNLLMLGYLAFVKKSEFIKSCEVDQINWFLIKDAYLKIREGSIAEQLFDKAIKRLKENQHINE
ncbi:NUDIX domain-containing protein [Clostridium sp. D2Q-11]|uniref:NUDIX domain-containing protein n=1 Tax=Anaeromonas frigoriresistens TaxID=2683708 RepID=A0A942Z6H0_9FIRM|nr:NUDIX domain-containing protein [Anaeromonas frigoriresistens]MBS4538461.1 NUDIX domain-containing protein [Anaeromonas frigoriresistens]